MERDIATHDNSQKADGDSLNPRQIVSRLELTIGVEGLPRPLKTAIAHELVTFFGVPPLRAAELAEQHFLAVSRLISKSEQDSSDSGTIFPLTLFGSFYDAVAGSCYHLPEDTPTIGLLKRQRAQSEALLKQMQKMHFSEFETFGAKVLRELGATKTKVTSHANDQGIDFYGELSLGSALQNPPVFFKLTHDVKISFVGQAKHYPNSNIGPVIVRELVGAMSLARTKTFSKAKLDLFETVEIKPFSPLLAMLLTTGGLTAGAKQLAHESGIIARTGHQLAVFLADRGVGMEATSTGPVFNPDLFTAWLA